MTVELHGGLEKMVCTKCGAIELFDSKQSASHEAPLCAECQRRENKRAQPNKHSQCVGRMRPRITLYNESGKDDEAIGYVVKADVRSQPDALLIIGTSLKVCGACKLAKALCGATRRCQNGFTAWINVRASLGRF